MNWPGSSLQPHLSFELHSNLSLGSKFIVLSRFPQFVISWLPQKSRGVIGDHLTLKGEGKKSIFPFLVVTSLWPLYILLITLTIAYLISFTLPLQYLLGGKGKIPSPNASALLLLLFIKQRASEQATIGVFFLFWSRRAL